MAEGKAVGGVIKMMNTIFRSSVLLQLGFYSLHSTSIYILHDKMFKSKIKSGLNHVAGHSVFLMPSMFILLNILGNI